MDNKGIGLLYFQDLQNSIFKKVINSNDDLTYIRRISSESILDWLNIIDYRHNNKVNGYKPFIDFKDSVACVKYLNKIILFDAMENLNLDHFRGGEILAVLITHAHNDHIDKLPAVLENYPNAKIVMSEITFKIISEVWYSKDMYREIEMLNKNKILVSNNDKIEIDDYTILSYSSGHCMGCLSYFVFNDDWAGGIGFIGEFTARFVGGFSHSIPKLKNINSLILDGKSFNDDNLLPQGIAEFNWDSIYKCLSRDYLKCRIPIFQVYSLGALQELFSICANAVADGVNDNLNKIINIGTERKTIITEMKKLKSFEYKAGFSQQKRVKENTINIFTGNNFNGLFYEIYNKYKDREELKWFVPQESNIINCDMETYEIYTHPSKSEVIEMIFSLDPENVYLINSYNISFKYKNILENLKFKVFYD